MTAPVCPRCGIAAELDLGGAHPRWECCDCGARVGCRPGTTRPLGTLADAETRDLRVLVHRNLDPIWDEGQRLGARDPRSRTYRWFARVMGLPEPLCHVGMFDAETCRRALDVLQRYGAEGWMAVVRWDTPPPPACEAGYADRGT